MGVSTRYFLVEEGADGLVRIPVTRVERWYRGEERAPEFAGKTVRFLVATCVTEGRRVASVAEVRPRRVRFLADGRLDVDREMALASALFEMHAGPIVGAKPRRALDLMPRVQKKRLHEKHGFRVEEEHMRALRAALLGGAPSGRGA